jgi:hypothetical protein
MMGLPVLRDGRSLLSPHQDLLALIPVRGWVNPRVTARLDGLGKYKNPVASLGIEPATFRLLA